MYPSMEIISTGWNYTADQYKEEGKENTWTLESSHWAHQQD